MYMGLLATPTPTAPGGPSGPHARTTATAAFLSLTLGGSTGAVAVGGSSEDDAAPSASAAISLRTRRRLVTSMAVPAVTVEPLYAVVRTHVAAAAEHRGPQVALQEASDVLQGTRLQQALWRHAIGQLQILLAGAAGGGGGGGSGSSAHMTAAGPPLRRGSLAWLQHLSSTLHGKCHAWRSGWGRGGGGEGGCKTGSA